MRLYVLGLRVVVGGLLVYTFTGLRVVEVCLCVYVFYVYALLRFVYAFMCFMFTRC